MESRHLMTDTRGIGYEVTVQATDRRGLHSERTRAFPSGANGTYAAALPLASGNIHWVQVSICDGRSARVSGGNKTSGSRFVLVTEHEQTAELHEDRATINYALKCGLKVTVTIAPRAAKVSGPPAPAVGRTGPKNLQQIVDLVAAEAIKPAQAAAPAPATPEHRSTLQSWIDKLGFGDRPTNRDRAHIVVRQVRAAKRPLAG